jgi:hypothetical protein
MRAFSRRRGFDKLQEVLPHPVIREAVIAAQQFDRLRLLYARIVIYLRVSKEERDRDAEGIGDNR